MQDAEQDYDVILCPRYPGHDAFAALLARCSNPAAPLVALAEGHGARADTVLRNPTADALASAIASLAPLIADLARLPRIPPGSERAGLVALALAHTRNRAIAPAWRPDSAGCVGYPLLLGFAEPRAILEQMADAGLLQRRFFERLHACEHCTSSRLHVREVCTSCRSSHLLEQPLVHHYRCGTQAVEGAFEQRNGYRCPKCKKELRHFGVDYDKPGTALVCRACGGTMSEPETAFVCTDCGRDTPADRAERRDWFEYEITADGVDALRTGRLPRSDLVLPGQGAYLSLRDFALLARQQLQVAQRRRRPLSGLRIDIDFAELGARLGGPGAREVRALIRDLVAEEIRDGDLFAALPGAVVACLPETEGAEAQVALKRISQRVRSRVGVPVMLGGKVLDGAGTAALLDELH